MREILFRAKLIYNGEWVYGGYISSEKNDYIAIQSKCGPTLRFVDPNTVGQYTGLNDKNGTRIFEGDITNANGMSNSHSWQGYIDKELANRNHRLVAWGDNSWKLLDLIDMQVKQGIQLRHSTQNRFTVIGNIFDNPELIKHE